MPPEPIEPYQYIPHGAPPPPARGEIWTPGPAVCDGPLLVLHNDGSLAITVTGNPRRELRMEFTVWQFGPVTRRWWCDAAISDADARVWLKRYM